MTYDSTKSEMLKTLKTMLDEALRMRNEGATFTRITRAQGYVDGYMRALLDSGVVTSAELLRLVAEQRRAVDGPSTRILSEEPRNVVAA
jgi:hypothetical protein